jgi:hypothetical protein
MAMKAIALSSFESSRLALGGDTIRLTWPGLTMGGHGDIELMITFPSMLPALQALDICRTLRRALRFLQLCEKP